MKKLPKLSKLAIFLYPLPQHARSQTAAGMDGSNLSSGCGNGNSN